MKPTFVFLSSMILQSCFYDYDSKFIVRVMATNCGESDITVHLDNAATGYVIPAAMVLVT